MASSSLDGLVAVHDVSKPFDDDDAFVAAINVATSAEELNMYGPAGERLWVSVCARMCVCAHVCVRACVCVCTRACSHPCHDCVQQQ